MSNYLIKIAITGGNGQLATALGKHVLAEGMQIDALSRADFDITRTHSIERGLNKSMPDLIINTAAYTAVDKAEREVIQAMQVNFHGTQKLASACQLRRIPLVHISTDYIFDGLKSTPYQEEDPANPLNNYGNSKWLSEQAVREHCDQYVILRVSGVFSEYGNNFLKTILRLAREKKQLQIIADQITCPTYAGDIAGAILSLVKQQADNFSRSGTYHYCSQKPVSWHQFASTIITEAKKTKSLLIEELKAISTAQYPTAAKRPAYSVLNCDRIKQDFAILQPAWEDGVKKALIGLGN